MSLPPIECKYITEEILRECKNGNSNFSFSSPVPMLRCLYELCWTMVRGELPFQKCKAVLDAVEFTERVSEDELASCFADIVTQMAQDFTMAGEHHIHLIKLAKWLLESSLVPLRLFQERCEEEFLSEAEMIKIKASDLKVKEVRVNTRLLYQQTKFNLLREESEGYAKLVTLLCRGSEDSTQNSSTARIGIIKSLIGHFDLDPNRVFNIVLECYELQPDNNAFLQLIPIFPKSHASQILGFKFQYYQRLEVNTPTPFGLYRLTAILVKEDFIDLDSIYAHLLPKDDEAFEHYNGFSAKRLDEANKIGKINLAATGKDLMEDEKQGDVKIDLFVALDMENEVVDERSSKLENSQTLGLLTGFLSVDDWCKKYPSMELRGIFQYLVNQLQKGQGIELVLLQELIQQMANVQFTENLTEEQLDAMAGSETLRYQATSFGVTRNNKALIKSTNRLRDSLLPKDEPKLAIPLLLLIAQHRSLVVINADAPYIKMVSEQFDRVHGTFLQYVEFLCSAVIPPAAYAQLIPSLDDLVHLYHLDPEVAFLIYRPVMRLFKCQGSSDVFWPLDVSETADIAMTCSESDSKDDSSRVIPDLGPPWKPTMWSELLDTVKTMLPSKAWNSLSPDLYATFWGLTLYDLYVPRNVYESEIAKQHAALKALEELPDNSSSAISKRKKDKERIQEALDCLTSELHKHEENVSSVRRRLTREKDKWLSSCPDTLKINMEFLQRCIFPRCTFSMADAVYCAMFVHTLHSLGTPFFNTVNHIDVLICKTLQPMICCCTEYEAGRLGRFLYETLKIAYYWKSDESIYEHECGNMPGFAVYYRYPNSQRVTYGQFIKVHWKWSQRITRLLIQCLESTEYMEIRNALIVLTKISIVFPVTRKSGINLEKRVAKIKNDEREDLKVLATGVAAALAARKSSWVTDEEFGMGYLELKPVPPLALKSVPGNAVAVQNGSSVNVNEDSGGGAVALGTQQLDANLVKDQVPRTKSDGRSERAENAPLGKSNSKTKVSISANGSDAVLSVPLPTSQSGAAISLENQKPPDDSSNKLDRHAAKIPAKNSAELESKASAKRSAPTGSLTKTQKQDPGKDEAKSVKAVGKTSAISATDRDIPSHIEGRQGGTTNVYSAIISNGKDDGSEVPDASRQSSRMVHSPKHDGSVAASKSIDKLQKRTSPVEETDRLSKRRKVDIESKDLDGEVRLSDRERSTDHRSADFDKSGNDEVAGYRNVNKPLDRSKDKGTERHDRDYRDRLERSEKSRADDILTEKSRDKSIERHGRERSVERSTDRNLDRVGDKAKDERSKDERSKIRHADTAIEKSHADDRFHAQSLPPPPPLPPHMVPQSVNATGRRDDDPDRRFGSTRHTQRLSPRHEEERRRSEENSLVSQDDGKRRREDDFRERKREEREGLSLKVEEREREREKANVVKEDDADATGAKRRKLKRDHLPSDAGQYSPVAPPPPPLSTGIQSYDGRERDRKGSMMQRGDYLEEPGVRIHGKEATSKMTRRDTDLMYGPEQKRRHRK
ncbi:THO complex subunit 2-like isoform X3 [Hibiscus syriacus]|uniref:THO complex subunit 2-like isoform X3 n=1 Tax=Hibiscus syriacus TaxID=106335 RepID=UPI001922EFCF|nr:THO complex subunit 2-like isoform X3 [Hibiscus syriacus]